MQLAHLPADRVGGDTSETTPRGVHIERRAFRARHRDEVAGRLQDFDKASTLVLDLAGALAVRSLAERALYCSAEATQVVFQNIIGRAGADRLDGALLTDGAGDEDERHL